MAANLYELAPVDMKLLNLILSCSVVVMKQSVLQDHLFVEVRFAMAQLVYLFCENLKPSRV